MRVFAYSVPFVMGRCSHCGADMVGTRTQMGQAPSHVQGPRRCCSRACFNAMQQRTPVRECKQCHSPFMRRVDPRHKGDQFCSRACVRQYAAMVRRLTSSKAVKPMRFCEICGNPSGRSVICSRDCELERNRRRARARYRPVSPQTFQCKCGASFIGRNKDPGELGKHCPECREKVWTNAAQRRARIKLTDGFIRAQLRRRNPLLRGVSIPRTLLEAERAARLVRRELNKRGFYK